MYYNYHIDKYLTNKLHIQNVMTGVEFIFKLIDKIIELINMCLWNVFLPVFIIVALYITYRTVKFIDTISVKDKTMWEFSKIKNSLFVSLSSKIGTGAIIGVLAAMRKASYNGIGGEGIVLWVIIGMLLLVPVTYSEVLFSMITKKTPKDFIAYNVTDKASVVYSVGLTILYSFGFVGFQLTGIQSIIKIVFKQKFNYEFTYSSMMFCVILPLIIVVSLIVILKSYKLFINVLGFLISFMVLAYVIFFIAFLVSTADFIPKYLVLVWNDFIRFRSASIGIPIGFIVGLQRIIQTSETALGTSALSSADAKNSPRREAIIQVISTVITIFIAVVITSYVFTYGRYNVSGINLSANGFERILAYLRSAISVTGYWGGMVIIIFFILSGFTTVLGSFHFLNRTMSLSENRRILFYISLITLSGILSISNFDTIFEVVNLLMFIVSFINILAMLIFAIKNIYDFKIR
ncbi:hypothetical protein CLTEP_14970 [Clostridium tepidiprofundi DSM 19306]|uniref:Amino-acid carrier protein AlsT n=1 Tax=Clostridium tepidiprofundi DSM 19306 TaxID=1121338 RepID=A0A151B3R5_9CLOT|nr:alanine:cation symporter family protein [Clostridium tepidiprofundi]KYH34569.1 hypothetical protein CLTEP_14970 [Clostridium tepidiprofundi DSM 19306]